MNKTIDISLAGMLFHLDEPAYHQLKRYLEHIKKSISNQGDTEEIMNEIEARIAELLSEKINNPQQVVNSRQIEEIIGIIGKPEDFEETDETHETYSKTTKKNLFRDPEHSMIGGVAAGLAHYVGMDITWMRIIFIILLFVTHGGFLLIYVLLWILIPKAKTASDFLRMHGENPTIEKIVDQVNADESVKKKMTSGINQVETGVGNALLKILGVLLSIFAGILLLGLIIFGFTLIPSDGLILQLQDDTLIQGLNISMRAFMFLVILLSGIPILFLFMLGVRLLVPNSRKISTNFYWIAGSIWILTLIFISVELITAGAKDSHVVRLQEIQNFYVKKDTLQIKAVHSAHENASVEKDIHFRFYTSDDSLFHVKIRKYIQSKNSEAYSKQWDLSYSIEYDSIQEQLHIPLETNNNSEMNIRQKIRIYLSIPKNKCIQFNDDFTNFYKNYPLKKGDIICNSDGFLKINGKNLPHKKEFIRINQNDVQVKIGYDGIYITSKKGENSKLKINNEGVDIQTDNGHQKAKLRIDNQGIKIKTEKP